MKILKNKYFVNIVISITLFYLTSQSNSGLFEPVRRMFGFPGLMILLCATNLLIILNKGITNYKKTEIIAACIIIILGIVPSLFFAPPKGTVILAYYPFLFLSIYIIFLFLRDFNDINTNKVIAYLLFAELLLTTTVTILYSLSTKQPITRFMTVYEKEWVSVITGIKNMYLIGGFGTVYVAPIVSLISIEKIRRKKYVFAIPLITSLLILAVSDFFFSWIELVICLSIYLFLLLKKKIGIKKATAIVLGVCCLTVIAFLCGFYLNLLPGNINERVLSIIKSVTGSGIKIQEVNDVNGNPLNNRIYVYKKGINGLISNRFLYKPSSIILCNHSYLLDNLLMYGFLSIFLWYFYAKVLKEVKNTINCNSVFYAMLAYYIVHITLNHANDIENPIMILIILPFILYETTTKVSNNE